MAARLCVAEHPNLCIYNIVFSPGGSLKKVLITVLVSWLRKLKIERLAQGYPSG